MQDTLDIYFYKILQIPLCHLISTCYKTQLHLYIFYYNCIFAQMEANPLMAIKVLTSCKLTPQKVLFEVLKVLLFLSLTLFEVLLPTGILLVD